MTEGHVPDFGQLTMTEIVRLQGLLQQELTRRFERQVLLVFSDIVDSTPYCARYGDAAGRQMQQLHIDLLEQCIGRFQGRVVDVAGDGAFLVFSAAEAAVQSMVAVQGLVSQANLVRASAHQLRLRVGLHWGPVLTDGAIVSGDSVNLCARIAASAAIGEIRLTRAAFQQLGSAERMQCRALGAVQLKGVNDAIEVLAYDWRDRSRFPTQLRIVDGRRRFALQLETGWKLLQLERHPQHALDRRFAGDDHPQQDAEAERQELELEMIEPPRAFHV